MLVDLLATLQNSIVFQVALAYFAAYPIVTSILWVTTSLMFRLRWEPRSEEVVQPAGPSPAVSVLVPAHNEEAVITRSVRAMLAMDYPDFEVIVIDDGSTDDTAGALGRLAGNPRLRIVRKVVNEGKAMALNDALPLARRLDREAYGQVERTLGELQSRLSRQGDDLAFYRSIVSPADGIQGLRIQRFDVVPGPQPREFLLKLTLIQAMRHESVASGLAQIVLHGMQGQEPAKYTVGDLIGRPRAQLPFSFRYFQTVEQAVTLPEGFQAFEAQVEVRSSKLRFPMEQTFPWKVDGVPAA